MKKLLPIILGFTLLLFSSCDREIEEEPVDLGYDYQPLEVGLFWIYDAMQITYFGENDSEQEFFFFKDRIRSFYTNEVGEQVFIVSRSKSLDEITWNPVLDYTIIQREQALVRTIENQPLVPLVFPPKDGVVWNGNAYRSEVEDEFQLIKSGNLVRIEQENSDDKVTYRDIRYEVYEKGVGMIEKYEEVLTYCSRNDCLGEMLIDSGINLKMILTDYGKD
ncbi:hypothetical protein [Algoriphagus sp.]|uniref:hypothetical protein n=1 Tax=Algoriphagus sp. TaxID=1872435 RepID=UPI003282865E